MKTDVKAKLAERVLPSQFSAKEVVAEVKGHFLTRKQHYRELVLKGKMPVHEAERRTALWSAIVTAVEKGTGWYDYDDGERLEMGE